jgi:hypothetical protein
LKLETLLQDFVKQLRELGDMPLNAPGRGGAKKKIVALFTALGNSFEIELAIYQAARGLEQQAATNMIKDAVVSLKVFPAPSGPQGDSRAYDRARLVDVALDTLYKNDGETAAEPSDSFDYANDVKILLTVRLWCSQHAEHCTRIREHAEQNSSRIQGQNSRAC